MYINPSDNPINNYTCLDFGSMCPTYLGFQELYYNTSSTYPPLPLSKRIYDPSNKPPQK